MNILFKHKDIIIFVINIKESTRELGRVSLDPRKVIRKRGKIDSNPHRPLTSFPFFKTMPRNFQLSTKYRRNKRFGSLRKR